MTEEPKVFKLGKLPEGSRLLRYSEQLDAIIRSDRGSFLPFLKNIYEDCRNFLVKTIRVSFVSTITLRFVPTHAEYLAIEKEENEGAIQKEVAKGQSYGFTVGNRFDKRVYVGMQSHVNSLEHGSVAFVVGLVETYIHELLHCAFNNKKSEQDVHEMQCLVVEDFLSIRLPPQIKNLKASDYYFKSD